MSARPSRNLPSLDYRELHSRGNYVHKERNSSTQPRTSVEGSDSTSSTKSSPLLDQSFSSERYNTSELDKELALQFKSFRMDEHEEVVPKEDEVEMEAVKAEFAAVAEEEEELEVLIEEFGDFLDENKIEVMVMNAQDFDSYVLRMEEYR